MRLLPVLLLLALPVSIADARPVASAAKSCSLSSAEKGGSKHSTLGPTYVTSLSASGVSCRKAKKVVKAFHSCRHNHGAAGKCSSVKGYSCSEKRVASPVQYESTATCKKGSKTVTHHYTQNT